MDTIERTYFAFRRRLRDIGLASTCDCNACIRIPSLDLKFVAHHGPIVRQRIAGREELVGSDVILAHRLLKNEVEERTGIGGYALYTDACVERWASSLGVLGLIEHRETYEHIGDDHGLGARPRGGVDGRARPVARDRRVPLTRLVGYEFDLPGPPAIVWEYLTSPARRPSWQHGVSEIIEFAPNGRRGVGTTNHCMHGKDVILEEILDWRPTDYLTVRWQAGPGAPKMLMSYELEATTEGAHVSMRFARPRSAKDRAFLEAMLPALETGGSARAIEIDAPRSSRPGGRPTGRSRIRSISADGSVRRR